MECVLRTYGLTKVHKGVPVVNGVTMHVRRGDIYGFVGRNGAESVLDIPLSQDELFQLQSSAQKMKELIDELGD